MCSFYIQIKRYVVSDVSPSRNVWLQVHLWTHNCTRTQPWTQT